MARVNPQVEQLEREVRYLRETIQQMRDNPGDIPLIACDSSCCVAQARGMSTNGGCRCSEHKLRMAVQYWRGVAEHRASIIQLMRDGDILKEES